jgi:hypothetical protein
MNFNIPYFSKNEGLVYCSDPNSALNNAELLYIAEAQKMGAIAVFFRRFYQNDKDTAPHHSEPAVTIFDEDHGFRFGAPEHIKLHASIWSAGKNEIYVLQGKTTIKIITARKPAEISHEKLRLDNLLLVSSALDKFNDERFSPYLFTSGTFWEQKDFLDSSKDERFYRNKLEEENMPYHQLLTFLKHTRKYLGRSKLSTIDTSIFDKLIIICLLIKFLEELKNDDGTHTLTKIYEKCQVSNFAEALSIKGKSIDILEELGAKLNGKIFDYFTDKLEGESETDFINRNQAIKNRLRIVDLSPISNFLLVRLNKSTGELDFDLLSKQFKLDFDFTWQQYSFRHLPIELISSIYEHFLQEDAKESKGAAEKGVVYTPPFLVNFLVDETMPLSHSKLLVNNNFRVLDPSCGSGIFLVTAYKRILQWWTINYYQKEKAFPLKYDPKIFQALLENNIYGVDISKKATLITIFSLTIAFLDKLDPIAFWENLDFSKLQKNIQTKNFFEWTMYNREAFAAVIGNPPFNVPIEYRKKEREYINNFVLKYAKGAGVNLLREIPDMNLALYFLEFIIANFGNIKICLIIPATVFLYSPIATAINYRNELLERIDIRKLFDFTHLRRILFHAETPVVAMVAENKPSNQQSIEHVVIKRLMASEKKIGIEIDHYDRHFVRWDWATNKHKQFIWKANLLGGGRLFHLVYRLSLASNLSDFINSQRKTNKDWLFEVGYEAGNSKKNEVVDYIYDQDKVSYIDDSGNIISESREESKFFYRDKKNKSALFTMPMLVIQKKIGKNFLPVGIQETYHRNYLVFNSSFVGIHAPSGDFEILNSIFTRFKEHQDTYLLWILTNSSSAMIGQETAIKKEELDTLPFPSFDDDFLTLSKSEKLLSDDVLRFYKHLGKSINEGDDGFVLHQTVDRKQLQKFGDTFCDLLNSIYAKNGNSWQIGKVYQTPLFVIYQFGFGKDKGLPFENLDHLDSAIESLIADNQSNSGAKYKRIIRIYDHIDGYDCLFIIKPHAQRYWLNSIALRDADDTYMDLKREGF